MKARWWAVGLLVAVAVVATVVLLWPRAEETGVPGRDAFAGRLFLDLEADVKLWLHRPAQTLPALLGADALRAGELAEEVLGGVRFGTRVLPPARAATVALVAEGPVVALDFSAGWRAVARLAGLLSGNPALRGEIPFSLDGRDVLVEWRAGTWVLRGLTTDVPERLEPRGVSSLEPAFGWLALSDRFSALLPAGHYRLDAVPGGVALESAEPPQEPVAPHIRVPERAAWYQARIEPDGGSLLAVWAPEKAPRRGEIRLPRAGAASWGSAPAPEMPLQGGWATLAGETPRSACRVWRCEATDPEAAAAMVELEERTPSLQEAPKLAHTFFVPARVEAAADHAVAAAEARLLSRREGDDARQLRRVMHGLRLFEEIELVTGETGARVTARWRSEGVP